MDHFKEFGCLTFAHIPNEKKKKLNDKVVKYVFFRVSEHFKAYKLFNLVAEKVIINRDIVFDEENVWNWIGEGNQQQLQLPADSIIADNRIEMQQQSFDEIFSANVRSIDD